MQVFPFFRPLAAVLVSSLVTLAAEAQVIDPSEEVMEDQSVGAGDSVSLELPQLSGGIIYVVEEFDVGWAGSVFGTWPFLSSALFPDLVARGGAVAAARIDSEGFADGDGEGALESVVAPQIARSFGDRPTRVAIAQREDGVWDVTRGDVAGDGAVVLADLLRPESRGEPASFTLDALLAITTALGEEHAAQSFRVWIDPNDIDPITGRDLRAPGEALTFRYAWDGATLEIDSFQLRSPTSGLIPDQELRTPLDGAFVKLHRRADDVWVVVDPDADAEMIPLAALVDGEMPGRFSVSAVQRILEGIRDAYTDSGLLGVRVVPSSGQLQVQSVDQAFPSDWRDRLRVPDFAASEALAASRQFVVDVLLAVVRDIRTVGSSPEPDPGFDTGVNLPRHRRFIREAPVSAYVGGDPDDRVRMQARSDAVDGLIELQGPGATPPGSMALEEGVADGDDETADGGESEVEELPVVEQARPRYLLRQGDLDDYLFRMSRYPGRRVDVAIAPGPDVTNAELGVTGGAGVSLDLLINESKPLFVYGQMSNTGTAQTDRLRYRFGLVHSQLSGNDDTLSLEFGTPDFSDNLAANASYSAKVGDLDTLRWRVYGGWGQFVASEVGFAGQDFAGDSWAAGGELAFNFFQKREHFVDLIAGARFLDARTEDALLGQSGAARYLVPYAGLRYERLSDIASTDAMVVFEYSDGSWTDNDPSDLTQIGRLSPDDEWYKLRWDISHAFYLEPVLNPEAWRDLSTPESSTLAHELAFRVRGQYAFNRRLIPQEEQVAGGLFSVRGYPESVSVGDTVVLATAEYRLHMPRLFGINPNPGQDFLGRPFRASPQFVLGPTDWDLILRGFADFGYTEKSKAFSFEDEEFLFGAGVGVQLKVRNNLDVRLDWGFAIEELDGRVESGSNRLHLLATILF